MYPIDIKGNQFYKKIQTIKNDSNFLASAITMPYKKRIKSKVLILDKISKYANAINFILNKKGILYGFNTDVYGAIESVKKCKKKKIIIFGFGGAGEAIFRVFCKIYKQSTFVIISKIKYLYCVNITYQVSILYIFNLNTEILTMIKMFICLLCHP